MKHFLQLWDRQPQWLKVIVSVTCILVAYYEAPINWTGGDGISSVLVTLLVVGILAWVLAGQARRHFSGEQEVRLPLLVSVMTLVLAVFALGYYALDTARPDQMADLETRTDALYFTMSVLTTVGLGDVHAVGQVARVMVTIQMAFDLVFVAAGGSLLASAVRSNNAARLATPTATPAPGEALAPDPSQETKNDDDA